MRAYSILLATMLWVISPGPVLGKAKVEEPQTKIEKETLAAVLSAPAPEYPYAARRDWLQGQGLYLVRFDTKSGLVREVAVIHSTGHTILDEAAINSLHQWRIKPHTFEKIKVPFNFELDGEGAAAMRATRGNLLYAPRPHYPLEAAAHGVAGRGRFLLLINPVTGRVTEVRILQTTHDERLDRAAVKAFGQWRFRPHTLSKLIVPLNFALRYR